MKKEIIISFILGAIISSVVGVIAANTISSSSVLYKNDKTVNTVLDELFETVDAIESDDTRLTSLEGKVNTLTSTHTSDTTRIDNSIDELNRDITNLQNRRATLLWTNTNLDSSEKTITLDLSKYDTVKIVWNYAGIENGYIDEMPVGTTRLLNWTRNSSGTASNIYASWRKVTANQDSFVIGNGFDMYTPGGAYASSNNIIIHKIYGCYL